MQQEYPTVMIVRRPAIEKRCKTKIKYYGPFTSAYALRENLRFLRRIFPYCKPARGWSASGRKTNGMTEFEYDLLKKRSIGKMPENRQEYLDMIKSLIKIIEGHTSSVKKGLKRQMREFSRSKHYEQAAKARDQMHWLDIFSNRQKIVSAKEYLERAMPSTDPSYASLVQLQKTLKLKNILRRIEGYDISNIQGQFAAGSMVVFTDGKPDKGQYRKFKINGEGPAFAKATVGKADDFAMLAEVLKRRFKHHGWKKPDVVLLDGGKGQLSAILNTIPSKTFAHSKFTALAKKQEKLYQGPGLKKITLDPKSPASQLLQRIRDEAHRFAQKYYHTLHSKSYDQNKS